MDGIAEALAAGLGATAFLVGFSSIRLRAERDRALSRSDSAAADLARAGAVNRAVTDQEVEAASRALGEARRDDKLGLVTVYVTFGIALLMVGLALVAGARSGMDLSFDPRRWATSVYVVLFFLIVDVTVAVLGALDYRWVGKDLDAKLHQSPVAMASRALGAHHRDEHREALTLASSLAARLPAWPWAHAFRSLTLARLDRRAEALEAIEQAIAIDGNNPSWRCERAELWIDDGEFGRALTELEALESILGDNATLLRLKSGALHGLGRLDEAISAYERAVRIEPVNPAERMRQGRALLGDNARHIAPDGPSAAFVEILVDHGSQVPLKVAAQEGRNRLRELDAIRAIACFGFVVERDPQDAAARAWLGSARFRAGQEEAAEQDFSAALAAGAAPYLVHRLRGRALLDLGHYRRAEAEFSAELAAHPTGLAYYRRSVLRLTAGRAQEALDDLDEALALDPSDADWMAHRAEVLAVLGRTAESDQAFTGTVAQGGHSRHLVDVWARTLLTSGRAAEAEQVLERGLSESLTPGERSQLLTLAGRVCISLTRFRRALDLLDEAESLEGPSPDIAYQRALCFAQLEDFDAAVEAITPAVDTRGSVQVAALATRGTIHRNSGKFELALSDYDAALVLRPESTPILVSRGCLLSSMGQDDQALRDFNAALEIAPRNTRALWHRVGVSAAPSADPDTIVEDLATLEEILGPGDPQVVTAHASYMFETQQWDRAAVRYRQYLKMNPDDPSTLWSLAACYTNDSQFREAEEIFRMLIRKNDGDFGAQAGLAVSLSQQGKFEDAVRAFRDLRDLDIERISGWVEGALRADILPMYSTVMGDWAASAPDQR